MTEHRDGLAKQRRLVGHTQESLAAAVGSSSRSVRNWEHGTSDPAPRLRPAIASALQITIEELDRLLQRHPSSASSSLPAVSELPRQTTPSFDYLFTKFISRERGASPRPTPTPIIAPSTATGFALSQPPSNDELGSLLLAPLSSWAATDNRIGPHALREIVSAHFNVIESFLDETQGTDGKQVAYIAARYAELSGWLAQDAGDFAAAASWTRNALGAARFSGSRELESYILMRQSSIATDREDGRLAIALADAAWHASRSQPGPLHVLALRQRAHAHTTLRNSTAALRDAEHARTVLQSIDSTPSDLTGFCTDEFLAMEHAACLVELGLAAQAIPVLEDRLQSWDPARRRDLGLCLSRLALAYVSCREAEKALEIALQAALIATATGSYRTRQVLNRVSAKLNQVGSPERARRLRSALSAAPQP